MDSVAQVALVGMVIGLLWLSWQDSRAYADFKLVEDTADRIRFYHRWTIIPFMIFGLGGLAMLFALDRIDALWVLPAEFASFIQPFETAPPPNETSFDSMLGMAIGLALGLSIAAVIWWSRLKKMRQPVVGDIEALLPRNRREIAWCVPLALNAGITEEIFYRVALPMLVLEATGSIALSLAIPIAAFGLAHWYQGWKGVLATGAVGALLFWVYLSSGSILKPIVMHVIIDIIALVIRPLISERLALHNSDPSVSAEVQSQLSMENPEQRA